MKQLPPILRSGSPQSLLGCYREKPITPQRRPTRASLQQADRLPLSTYEQAVNRLVELSLSEDITNEAYDLAVQVLSDVFWETETKLRADVMKARKANGA